MKKIYLCPSILCHVIATEGHLLSGSKNSGTTDRYSTTGNGTELTPTGRVDIYSGDGSVIQRSKQNDADIWDE